MRKSPVNYFITVAIFVVFWFSSGFLLSATLAENIPLMQMLPSEWRMYFNLFTGVTSGTTLIFTVIWFIYGCQEARVEALDKAKSVWQTFFYTILFICIILFVIFVIILIEEQITAIYYIVTFGILLLQSLGLYWLTTFFFSPSNVEFIPYGK